MGWQSGTSGGGGGGSGNIATINGDAGPAVVLTLDGIATAEATAADVDFGGHKAINLADPTAAQHAATRAYVLAQIALLVDSAPGLLNTLAEIDAAIANDPSFATTMTTALAGKQGLDAELTALAGLVSAADKLPYFTGSGSAALTTLTSFVRTLLAASTAAAARTTLGLDTAATQPSTAFDAAGAATTALASAEAYTDAETTRAQAAESTLTTAVAGKQAADTELTALAGLTSAADRLPYFTGSGTAGLATFTAFARTVLALATAADVRTALGLGDAATHAAADFQLADTGLDAVRKALAGFTGPQSSFDRFRATPRPKQTKLNGALSDTTSSTITVYDSSFTTAGKPELIEIVDFTGTTERCLAIMGLGTTAIICQRGADGTTAATHLDGCIVRKAAVANALVIGDSTSEGVVSTPFPGWIEHLRQAFDDRFGGILGYGFLGLWRDASVDASFDPTLYPGWQTNGSFTATPATSRAWYGLLAFSATGSTSNWKRIVLTGQRVQQVDILSLFTSGINNDWSYRYSWDNLVTFSSWIDDPQRTTMPANTTLGSADNARSLSYWDGTKTMAVAATANMKSAGYVQLTVATGQVATFSYQGVASSTSLSNVALISGDPTWTSATSQGVAVVGQVKASRLNGFVDASGNPAFPTHIEIRAAKADGTTSGTAGLWIGGAVLWDVVPTFGVTSGRMLHNVARDGVSLAELQNADTWDDFATTINSTTVTTQRTNAGTAAIGQTIIHPNLPSGTVVRSITNSTTMVVSNQATATGTAVGTIYGNNFDALGNWAKLFDGGSGSLPSDLCILLDTNAMIGVSATNGLGGDRIFTGSISGNVLTLTVGTFFTTDVNKVVNGATNAGTYISAVLTGTTATVVGTASQSSFSGFLWQLPATINAHIQNTMAILEARLGGYCDTFYLAPFEQGGSRLDGSQATAAIQQGYRTAITAKAAALTTNTPGGRPSFDVYNNWVAHGITGFTQATTAGYMVGASSPFHETDLGYRDMAASISRILEFA